MRRTVTSLFVVIVAFACRPEAAAVESYAGGGFQTNQIGPNAFVSSPKGEVYLILNTELYHNTKDSGDSWDRLARDIKAVALDPRNENVIYGIDTQDHVVKSLDAGKQWLQLNTGFGKLPFLTIAVNPADSQEVLVGSTVGLFRTNDAGFTWRSTPFVLSVNQIVFDPHTASTRYVLSAGHIFVSTDGGATWKKSEAGLPTEVVRGVGRTATKVTVLVSLLVPVEREKPFVLAAASGHGVLRTDDAGSTWKPVGPGLDASETFLTAASGKQRIVLASLNHLYSSNDGMTWNKPAIRAHGISPLLILA